MRTTSNRTLRWALGALLAAGCTGAAMAQPANDTCGSNRASFTIPPAGGSVSGDLTGATRDVTDTACPFNQTGPDVYWYFTPSFSGPVRFSTCNGATFDTVLSLHSDSCPLSAATSLGCNDDSCALQSQFQASVTAGTTYIVRVAGYSNATILGPYTLSVTPLVALTNDECSTGNPALTVGTPVSGDTAQATTTITIAPGSVCGPAGDGAGGTNDVFFRFIPPADGPYSFSLCGSGYDTVLSVHSACPVSSANVVSCNDDSTATVPCTGTFSLQSFIPGLALTGGQTYYVRVGGYAGATGLFSLLVTSGGPVLGSCCAPIGTCTSTVQTGCPTTSTWTSGGVCDPNPCPQPQPPSNDACSNSVPALTLDVPLAGTNVAATTDGASSCPAAGNARDVYFRFTPTASDAYTFTTCSATIGLDSVLSVHSGCPATTSNELGCNDDAACTSSGLLSTVVVQLTAGTQYIARVAGYAGGDPAGDQDVFQITVTRGGVVPVQGACCAVTGTCTLTAPAGCTGTYQGDNTTCSPSPCTATAGACCDAASGGCTITDQTACFGTFQGIGVLCAPNPCPQPGQGACCAADGSCAVTTQAACSGTFRGVGSACPPNPACPQPQGACCNGGACTTTDVATCTSGGGVFQGVGVLCTPNPCPQPGVCCRGATCATSTQANCTGTYSQFRTAAACNAPGNFTTPCCHANYNKVGSITVQDVFDFVTDWFSALPRANLTGNGNGPPGVQSIFDFLTAWFNGGCV